MKYAVMTHVFQSDFKVGLAVIDYNQYTYGSKNLNKIVYKKLHIFGMRLNKYINANGFLRMLFCRRTCKLGN